jgi:surfeit locus 1 family protein
MSVSAGRDAKGFPWVLSIATLVALAILLSLGTWQVRRLAWKEGLIATIDSRVNASPVPLAEVERTAASGGDFEYRPVATSGTYLHAKEQFFFATHEGQSGWFVYTPLQMADGRAVLVNRGFVPYDRKSPETRQDGQIGGEIEVVGLARSAPAGKPSWLVPDNQPDENVFYWKDLAAMTANAGLDPQIVVPFFIDAQRSDVPGGYPIGGVTIVELPNNHLQYAVTWYGLAAALLGVYVGMLLRRRKTAPNART